MHVKTPFYFSGMGFLCSENGFVIGNSFLDKDSEKFITKALNKHKVLVKCLKDVLKHDGGAYNLEPRQSKMIMEALKGIR